MHLGRKFGDGGGLPKIIHGFFLSAPDDTFTNNSTDMRFPYEITNC